MDASRRLHALPLAVLLAVAVSACGTSPTRPSAAEQPRAARALSDADAALARGDTAGAAALLERAAADAAPSERSRLLLRAARLHLEMQQSERAAALLGQLAPESLPNSERYQRDLLQSWVLVQSKQADVALSRLAQLAPPPPEHRVDWLRLQADALAASGQPLLAAQARDKLEPLLADPAAKADNRHQLWSLLNEVPLDQLRALMPPPPDEFGGWLELAFLTRAQRLNGHALMAVVQRWQDRYPQHPALAEITPQLMDQAAQAEPRQYRHLALLLPLSGPLAGPAQAILDGFKAAHEAAEGDKPRLSVIDIGPDGAERVAAAYQEAIQGGADFIVGPLTKEAVAALAPMTDPATPVLALNTLPPELPAPAGLYQFGLAPEDEAAAAADYALARGYRRVLVLTPAGDWGARVQSAFSNRLQEGGGTVLEQVSYDPQGADFSEPIRALLNLDASEQRYRQLRNVLRRTMGFEPYRRSDVDAIFIGAFPREARLIQPQLQFFRAMGVPLIATSHAYSGFPDPSTDHDLEGLQFVDMPSLLAPTAPNDTEQQPSQDAAGQRDFPRLYAFGMDAYRLVGYAQTMHQHVGESIDGATGVLSLDSDGRVRRKLRAARFVQGRPVLIEDVSGSFGPGAIDATPR